MQNILRLPFATQAEKSAKVVILQKNGCLQPFFAQQPSHAIPNNQEIN
jgi:hypothetical protein